MGHADCRATQRNHHQHGIESPVPVDVRGFGTVGLHRFPHCGAVGDPASHGGKSNREIIVRLPAERTATRRLGATPPPADAHRQFAAPATHRGQVVGQHQQAKRDHPEPQHRKKAENPAQHKATAEADAQQPVLRQPEFTRSKSQGSHGLLNIAGIVGLIVAQHHLPVVCPCPACWSVRFNQCGLRSTIAQNFFDKWLGNRAFLFYTPCTPRCGLFPGSSVVEQLTVNQLVAGSNPARGAKFFKDLAQIVLGSFAFGVPAGVPPFTGEPPA